MSFGIKLFLFLFVVLLFNSCISPSLITKRIDNTVEKIEIDSIFSTTIYVRSRGHHIGSWICFLQTDSSKAPYVIDARIRKKKILSVDKDLVYKRDSVDFLSDNQIESLMKLFMVSNSSSMQIDNSGNMYFYRFWGVYLKNRTLIENEIPKGFKKLKNNWYFYRYKLNE